MSTAQPQLTGALPAVLLVTGPKQRTITAALKKNNSSSARPNVLVGSSVYCLFQKEIRERQRDYLLATSFCIAGSPCLIFSDLKAVIECSMELKGRKGV